MKAIIFRYDSCCNSALRCGALCSHISVVAGPVGNSAAMVGKFPKDYVPARRWYP